jgi:hypothetical protein
MKWAREFFAQNNCHYSQGVFDDLRDKVKFNLRENLGNVLKVLET